MKNPFISIIIPTYNNERYILESINSVLDQSYKNFEIIVVDDGSIDNTKKVLDDFIRNGVIRYFYQENMGPGAARNLGIKVARGEYISFLDADDSWTSDCLEKRINLLKNTPGLRIVFSNYFVCPTQSTKHIEIDRIIMDKWKHVAKAARDGIVIKGDFSDLFEIPFFIWTGSIILEKSIFQEIGLFRTDVFIGEDRDMWIKAVEHSPHVGYVDVPLAFYNRFRGHLTKADPVDYARTRENLNFSLLEKYRDLKNSRNISRVIHSRLSWVYYDLGVYYHKEKQSRKAFYNLFKSIYYNPWNFISAKFMAFSIIPENIKHKIKRIMDQ